MTSTKTISVQNPRCECGFEFECRPGHFRNFNMKMTVDKDIRICPQCGAEYESKGGFPHKL